MGAGRYRFWFLWLALGVFSTNCGTSPAEARRREKPARFFEAALDGAPDNLVWLAADGKKLSGRLGVGPDVSSAEELRVKGSFQKGQISARVKNALGGREGSLTGAAAGGSLAGSYVDADDLETPFEGTEAAAEPTAMSELAGTYRAEDGEVSLKLSLTARGGLTLTARANVGFSRVKLGTIKGKWLADTAGHVWLLITSVKTSNVPGVPVNALPKEGLVEKADYSLSGGVLTLTDPFDPEKVLYRVELAAH